jgi:hypothetical protein
LFSLPSVYFARFCFFPENGRVDGLPQSRASRRGTRRYTTRRRQNRYDPTLPAL